MRAVGLAVEIASALPAAGRETSLVSPGTQPVPRIPLP